MTTVKRSTSLIDEEYISEYGIDVDNSSGIVAESAHTFEDLAKVGMELDTQIEQSVDANVERINFL